MTTFLLLLACHLVGARVLPSRADLLPPSTFNLPRETHTPGHRIVPRKIFPRGILSVLSHVDPQETSDAVTDTNSRGIGAPRVPGSHHIIHIISTHTSVSLPHITIDAPNVTPTATPLSTLSALPISPLPSASPLPSTSALTPTSAPPSPPLVTYTSVSSTSSLSSASNFPETTTSPSNSPSRSPGIKTEGILGIVLGGVALFAVSTIGSLLWRRKRRAAAFIRVDETFGSERARTYPFPYMVQAFLTPRSRGDVSKKNNEEPGSSPAPAQQETSAVANTSMGERSLVGLVPGHTHQPAPENAQQSTVAQARDLNQSEAISGRIQTAPPKVASTVFHAEPSAALLNVPPQPSLSHFPPSSTPPPPLIQQRRQSTDGGVRLAGGPPEEIYGDSEVDSDVDDTSTLPPMYGHY